MSDVVITAGCRTAIGALGGQYKALTALDLSIPVMQNLVQRAGIDPASIEDVIWGCNYQRTYLENNLARVALVKAGLPVTVPGITVQRNCTSSMSSVQMAYYQIRAGEAQCIMAGGADSMSNAPHMVFGARFGKKLGNFELRDSMWDSLTNLGVGPAMGITAENVAERYGISREDMDAYALQSQLRAAAAIKEGKFKGDHPRHREGQEGRHSCGSYKRYGPTVCSKHSISHKVLEEIVLADLNRIIAAVQDWKKLADERAECPRRNFQAEQSRLEISLERIRERKKRSYEDYQDGLLGREDYLRYREDYERQEKALHVQMEKLSQAVESDPLHHPWVEALLRYGKLTKLDRVTVAETIKQIRIFEDGHVEITYTFSNELGLLEAEGGITV